MLRLRFLPLLVLGFSLLASPALAARPKSIGQAGFWAAYVLHDGKQNVCYMTIKARPPAPSKGASRNAKKKKRGEVVLMVTHRPAENSSDVVSYTAGLKFKPGSDVVARVGEKSFSLFTQGDTAWSHDAATDHALAQALRAGSSLQISGTTASGEPLADTLILKGSDAAYALIGKACGVKVKPLPSAKASSHKDKTVSKKKTPSKKEASKRSTKKTDRQHKK